MAFNHEPLNRHLNLILNCSENSKDFIEIGKVDECFLFSIVSDGRRCNIILDRENTEKMSTGLVNLLKEVEVFTTWDDPDNGWGPTNLKGNTQVEVLRRNGKKDTGRASVFDWSHSLEHPMRDAGFDIVGYRVV